MYGQEEKDISQETSCRKKIDYKENKFMVYQIQKILQGMKGR